MRIGIDCRLWNESGVGRYIRNLIKNLLIQDSKNSYVLFVNSLDSENIKYQISNIKYANKNLKIITTDIRWHSFKEQLIFPSILNKENLDLVHFPYFSVPIFYNKPFVVTIHDLIINHFSTGLASTLSAPLYQLKLLGYKFVISQAVKKAKKVITVSNTTKDEIIDHFGVDDKKVIVTYEGVDKQKSKIKNQKSKIDKPYFLYVGNAYPHKNLERLLEAFCLFCHPELVSGSQLNRDSDLRQNDTKLIFVGKNDYFYERLKKRVNEMGLKDSVIFYGEVSDEELVYLYKNAKALVLPSLMEGFGLPALEAMSLGCLVLASDIPSFREICQDAAIYFNPNNVNDLAKKLKEICFNDLNHFSDFIKKGRERASSFSWGKMTKKTLEVYESCGSL
ncbi:MAG: glycosyltransferase family 1 protein [Candidatus Levyibacteriota bacterium]